MRDHDKYLDEESETVSARRADCQSPLESVRPMLLPKARREAHHAEVAKCALFATANSLKLQMGQNVKSPFSNIRAITFKLRSNPSRIAVASRLACKSRPMAKSP
jgi:sRNA-binding protein